MAAHARLSGSKIKQARGCKGSVLAQLPYPNRESLAARQGTAVHWLCEQVLLDRFAHGLTARPITEYVHVIAPNKIKITQAMVRAGEVYVDEVLSRATGADFVGIEVKLKRLTEIDPDLGGTSDAVIYSFANRTLYVMDYKNGSGVLVDPDENDQAMTYGLGALMLPELAGKPIDVVEIVIVQPNAAGNPVKIWRTDPARLMEWGGELAELGPQTRDPNAPRTAGSHCQFCLAAADCKPHYELALDAAGLTAIDFYSDVIPKVETADRLTPEELAKRLAQAEHLERWIKSIKAVALERALEDQAPQGFKAVAGRGSRKFKDANGAIAFLSQKFDLPRSAFFEESPLSVAQTESLLGKKALKNVDEWKDFVITQPGKPTLAPLSDPRAPISKKDGFDVFDADELLSETEN